jgi:sulfate permease, SulP family
MRLKGVTLARFRPRLLDSLHGYNQARFIADVIAGLTVGVVALPLAMAFAMASGVKPEQGIFTAIVAGFIISALGGSNVQIGGPAGAFIVIVYGIVERYGLTNLLISTVLAGALLFAMGALRLGSLVHAIPVSIIIGFTNGIAVLIAFSQVKDLLGLQIAKLPADFFAQIYAYAVNIGTINVYAVTLSAACVGGLFFWPQVFKPGRLMSQQMLGGRTLRTAARMPGPVVALVTLTVITAWFKLPVETIGTRFGGIPQGLPTLALPPFSWESAKQLLVPTLTIALLGAVESLLCARVADKLSNLPRHDPNQELMAQGVANIVCPFFGGIPATGTIARTVTNLRSGATSPIAGMVHALTLLVVVLVAAPLAVHVPLAAMAGILLFVAFNMGEWHEFARLRQFGLPYRTLLLGTFFLTVVFDLTVAIEVGMVLACGFFIYRMSALFRVERVLDASAAVAPEVCVYRLQGALFFGAVGKLENLEPELPADTRCVILQMHRLISIDSSGLEALRQLHRLLARRDVRLLLCELSDQPLALVQRSGLALELGAAGLHPSLTDALAACAATA